MANPAGDNSCGEKVAGLLAPSKASTLDLVDWEREIIHKALHAYANYQETHNIYVSREMAIATGDMRLARSEEELDIIQSWRKLASKVYNDEEVK